MKQLPFAIRILSLQQQSAQQLRDYELWLLLNGSLQVTARGTHVLTKQDVLFFEPGETVSALPLGDNTILAVTLDSERFRADLGAANPMVRCNSASVPGDYVPLVEHLRLLADAFFNRSDVDWTRLMSMYYQLLHLLERFRVQVGEVSGEAAVGEHGSGAAAGALVHCEGRSEQRLFQPVLV